TCSSSFSTSFQDYVHPLDLHSFPTRRSSDLLMDGAFQLVGVVFKDGGIGALLAGDADIGGARRFFVGGLIPDGVDIVSANIVRGDVLIIEVTTCVINGAGGQYDGVFGALHRWVLEVIRGRANSRQAG